MKNLGCKSLVELNKMRHSAAHIMAQAVVERFQNDGQVLLGNGPAVEYGFYFDFLLPRKIENEDLIWIEHRMKEIIREAPLFSKQIVDISEAKKLFASQPFKIDNLNDLSKQQEVKNGEPLEISIYHHADFFDLCSGPHVNCANEIPIEGIRIDRVAGAYWKGDENNAMLQRIYGLCFASQDDLQQHLNMLAEAQKRDHRILGKELDLFFFSDNAPGMPYWLPHGLIIYEELISFWRKVHKKNGYQEISSPLIHHQKMWEISGHWEHFREEMFLIKNPKDPEKYLGMKPMNCPDAMVVFNYKKRSYRELPLRLSDCDSLHRFEKSGALHGLLRVMRFSQDDAHIFLMQSQIFQEISNILNLVDHFYSIFELPYSFRIGLRPDKFVGEEKQWDEAEQILIQILQEKFGADKFSIDPGEGAFYGPKIDILIKDCLGREWQMGSIQLDFQLPRRFECKFINAKGEHEVPIVIHRVIYGSLERFIGILLENFAGRLPPWLSPIQIAILPIREKHLQNSLEFLDFCENYGFRCSLMSAHEHLSERIRKAEAMKIPFIVVMGDKEIEGQNVSVRIQGQNHLMSQAYFVDFIKEIIDNKVLDSRIKLS